MTKDNYTDLPLSDLSKADMSFKAGDQDFLKKLLDRQDSMFFDAMEKMNKENLEQHAKLFTNIEKIHKMLFAIKGDILELNIRLDKIELILDDKEKRILALEKYATPTHTLIRMALTAVVGALLVWLFHR